MGKTSKFFWLSTLFCSLKLFGVTTAKDTDKTDWHVPLAVGVLLIQQDEVFLLKRAYKDWGYGVVAGELKKGETFRHAAARHVEKEVGVKVKPTDLKFVCFVHYKTENTKESPLVFFFSTEKWYGKPFNKEPGRHSEAEWFSLNQLPTHLAPGEDRVFETYKKYGANPNAYLENGWGNFFFLDGKS